MATLQAQCNVILRTQEKILAIISSNQAETDLELDENIKLPVQSIEELTALELVLEDKMKRRHMSAILCSCIMDTAANTTRQILKKIFAYSVAATMNFAGQRTSEKIPLSTKENILKVIHGE